MATIAKTVEINTPAEAVWDAVADFGAVHRRFARGFVTDVALVEGGRMVTFANGLVLKELFLSCDHEARRLAYAARAEAFEHHSASFTVTPLDAHRCRLDWVADVLPDSLAPTVASMMADGIVAAQTTLDAIPT